jgi:hypothetical protein
VASDGGIGKLKDITRGLREQAMTVDPSAIGLSPGEGHGRVWGVPAIRETSEA